MFQTTNQLLRHWRKLPEGVSENSADSDVFIAVLLGITHGSMYGIYANIGGILMVNITIYSIHGSYG